MSTGIALMRTAEREHRATFRLAGDRVDIEAPAPLPDDLLDGLRQHRSEILGYLRLRGYRLKYPGDGLGPEDVAEIDRVERRGRVLLWVPWLQDVIAFCTSEAERARVPEGIVSYTSEEIAQLWSGGKTPPTPKQMRLIHAAKREGANVGDRRP